MEIAERTEATGKPSSVRTRPVLIGAVLLVLVLRVGWAFHISDAEPGAIRSNDTSSYVDAAHAVLEDRSFDEAPDTSIPMYFRTPGYPAFLAVLYGINDSDRFASSAQALLSISVVLVAFALGRRMGDVRTGIAAAAIVAVDPLQFVASGMLLTEALSSLTLLVIAWAAARVFTRPAGDASWLDTSLLGASLTVATLVRPTTYYFALLAAAVLLWYLRRSGVRRVLGLLVAFALPIVLVIGGWQVRNHERTGSWRYSSVEAVNLYCYRGAAVEADASGSSIGEARALLGCDEPWEGGGATCPDGWPCPTDPHEDRGPYYDRMAAEGVSVLLGHPIETAEMTVRGLVRTMFGPGRDETARYLGISSKPVLTAALGGWNLVLVAVALAGMVSAFRARDGSLVWRRFLCLLVVYYIVVSSGAESYARFRTPVVPLLALFAAPLVVSAFDRFRARGVEVRA